MVRIALESRSYTRAYGGVSLGPRTCNQASSRTISEIHELGLTKFTCSCMDLERSGADWFVGMPGTRVVVISGVDISASS